MNNNENGTKLLLTFVLIAGLIVAAVYYMRSRQQAEPESYVRKEVIKEEVKETTMMPEETVTVTETEQTNTDVK